MKVMPFYRHGFIRYVIFLHLVDENRQYMKKYSNIWYDLTCRCCCYVKSCTSYMYWLYYVMLMIYEKGCAVCIILCSAFDLSPWIVVCEILLRARRIPKFCVNSFPF